MEASKCIKEVKGLGGKGKLSPLNEASAREVINSTLCIDLSYLQKHSEGIIKMPYTTFGSVLTEDGACISFQSNCGNGIYSTLEIIYTINLDISYQLKVTLFEVDSNLGKGSFLYIICPVTGRKCRKLYKLPFSDKWASRAAYKGQMYYPLQICSRLQRYQAKFSNLKAKCKILDSLRPTRLYDGKRTKRSTRTLKLSENKQKAYRDLWLPEAHPISVQKVVPPELLIGLACLIEYD